jgi:hypothetical protein
MSRDSVEEEMFFFLQGEHLEIVVEEEREPLSNYLAKKKNPKVLQIVTLYSTYARALTSENFWQGTLGISSRLIWKEAQLPHSVRPLAQVKLLA